MARREPSLYTKLRWSDAEADHLCGLLGPVRRVLYIGTGTGELALKLAERMPHASLLGIDLSWDNVVAGRERALKAGIKNVAFREAHFDVVRRSFRDCSVDPEFDAIVFSPVLPTTKRPQDVTAGIMRACGNAYELLRTGGVFAIHSMMLNAVQSEERVPELALKLALLHVPKLADIRALTHGGNHTYREFLHGLLHASLFDEGECVNEDALECFFPVTVETYLAILAAFSTAPRFFQYLPQQFRALWDTITLTSEVRAKLACAGVIVARKQ